MSQLYEIIVLPEKKLPIHFLSYQSNVEFAKGQLVEINVRNQDVFGIVLESKMINESSESTKGLKSVNRSLPYIFDENLINFLFSFSHNTFNSINIVAQSFFQPFKSLTQKQWSELENNYKNNQNNDLKNNRQNPHKTAILSHFESIIDTNITLRIMYLIRSTIFNNNNSIQTNKKISLIIFPEKKFLSKVLAELEKNPEYKKFINESKIDSVVFTADASKRSKDGVFKLIYSQFSKDQSHLLIFTTRAGIFLPFSTLSQIILVDEGNSMYIQDQNSLYFDAREAVFLMNKAFSTHLTFLSTTPSIRLYNFNPEGAFEQMMTNYSSRDKDGFKIKITKRDLKNDNFQLFSNQVLDILHGNNHDTQIFRADDDSDEQYEFED